MLAAQSRLSYRHHGLSITETVYEHTRTPGSDTHSEGTSISNTHTQMFCHRKGSYPVKINLSVTLLRGFSTLKAADWVQSDGTGVMFFVVQENLLSVE